jgi:upstream activation factor subunit UAF30
MAKTNSAFMKPMTLSPELEAIVGKGPMPRSEITSKIWVYIKSNKLQDPKDGRKIIADDKLLDFFGGKKVVGMMELAGFVSKNVS